MPRNGRSRPPRVPKTLTARNADKHMLYEASVQSAEAYIELIERIFHTRRKRKLRSVREDFCGTARLCCEWVQANPRIETWGVDLEPSVLEWGRTHHFPEIGEHAERIHLLCDDVRTATTPPVDALIAFNFSYFIFKERAMLLSYLRRTHEALHDDGILFLDIFGGPQAYDDIKEPRQITEETTFDGQPIPTFTYEWEQTKFNQLNYHMLCYIHFAFPDGSRKNRAFRYDWRIWTPPEMRDLLLEAGYQQVHFYLQGWDDEADESDDIFRRRTYYNDLDAWFGYLIAEK